MKQKESEEDMPKNRNIPQQIKDNVLHYVNQVYDEAYELGYQHGKRQGESDIEKTQQMIEDVVQSLQELKDVPSREKGGTWIEKNSHTYICDKCGFEQAIYDNLNEYKFCPRCGINMEWLDRGFIPIKLNE